MKDEVRLRRRYGVSFGDQIHVLFLLCVREELFSLESMIQVSIVSPAVLLCRPFLPTFVSPTLSLLVIPRPCDVPFVFAAQHHRSGSLAPDPIPSHPSPFFAPPYPTLT